MMTFTIEELKRLDAEATPGEWDVSGLTVYDTCMDGVASTHSAADAALIVAMRNALPELLKALEAARELADWCEFEVGADTGLTPGLETLREYLPPHGGVDVG